MFGYVLNRKQASMGYENTRDDFETAAKKPMEYIRQFRQMSQEKEESYDDYATRLKQAAVPSEFPVEWQDVEIQLQQIDQKRKIKVSQLTPP